MKKGLVILFKVLAGIVLLVYAMWLALQSPKVQTAIAERALRKLEKTIDAKLSFSSVSVTNLNTIVVKDLLLLDNAPYSADTFKRGLQPVDTVAYIHSLSASFPLNSLTSEGGMFNVQRAVVDTAVFNLVVEPDTLLPTNLSRVLHLKKSKKEFGKPVDLFNIRRVVVGDFRFTMRNFREPSRLHEAGIDWYDMDLRASAKGRNLKFEKGRISCKVENGEVWEKCGYSARVSGEFICGQGEDHIYNVKLTDQWSDVNLDYFDMLYEDNWCFSDYMNRVAMRGKLSPSRLSWQSILPFAGIMPQCTTTLDIADLEIEGPVNDFTIRNLDATDPLSSAHIGFSGNARNLADRDSLIFLDIAVRDLRATTTEVESLAKSVSPDLKLGISKFIPKTRITLNAIAKGPMDSLDVKVSAQSKVGDIRAEGSIEGITSKGSPMEFSGILATRELNIGKITGIDKLGPTTLSVEARATLDKKSPKVEIETLIIDKLTAMGYAYSDIRGRGVLSGDSFDGKIISRDPNLSLLFQGLVSFSPKNGSSIYKFLANVGYADLHALGLDPRQTSTVSGLASVNLRTASRGRLVLGDVNIRNLQLGSSTGVHDIGTIQLSSNTNSGRHRIRFTSKFAKGGYIGDCSIIDALGKIEAVTVARELPSIKLKKSPKWNGETFQLDFDFYDSSDVLGFFLPGAYIASGSNLQARLLSDGNFSARLTSDRLAYTDSYFRGARINVSNAEGRIHLRGSSSELNYGAFHLSKCSLDASARRDSLEATIAYVETENLKSFGRIAADAQLRRMPKSGVWVDAQLNDSYMTFDGDRWDFSNAEFSYCAGDFKIKDLSFSDGSGSLKADGGISSTHSDTLNVNLNRFNTGILNNFSKAGFDIAGELYGYLKLATPFDRRLGLWADIVCPDFAIGGTRAGELEMEASLNAKGDGILLSAANTMEGRKVLTANAEYLTAAKTLDSYISLNRFDPSVVEPAVASFVSDLRGYVSGAITANGPVSDLSIRSEGIDLSDAHARIAYTGVPYDINGTILIDEKGINIKGLDLADQQGGRAHISGRPEDVAAQLNQLQLLGKADDGSGFYGNLFASGDAHVSATDGKFNLIADMITAKEGKLHIPLASGSRDNTSSVLSFKQLKTDEENDEYLARFSKNKKKKKLTEFNAKVNVTANPLLEAYLEIDKEQGNVLTGRGDGQFSIEVKPGDFSIGGDYNITSGKYHFSALNNLASKDFTIQDGSSIKFGGDVLDSEFDILATHSHKASLAPLLSDTTSVSSRRTVEAGIHITDKLRNPKLTFSITIPDLDPTTKSMVESALNTEDKVQKQFIALLVTGSFMASEQSGIINNNTSNTNIVYSNLASIVAGQINNLMQKFDIPVDLGLSYQQNEAGTDIFDVAVSTQLFGDRVSVAGSVGNRQYSTQSGDNMVGDVDIEVKLDDEGKVRLNLFSHSADDYTSYLDNTQRSGVGVTYQQEYNKLSDFFKRMFMNKQKRAEMDRQAAERKENRTRISIDE